MMLRTLALILVLSALPSSLGAQTTFWLRNTDAAAEFLYWTLELRGGAPAQVLPVLPLAPGGRHAVAPGERVGILLGPNQTLVGVFLPWADNLSFQTVLTGGFLLPSEVPRKGTLLVDRPSFAMANKGRSLDAPLQQWNLTVPQFVLDGRFDDWAKVRPSLEWGPAFLPGGQAWPNGRPAPRLLKAVNREGALWLQLSSDKPWNVFPEGVSVSLVLRRPGAFLEWPLTGSDSTVWSWVEGRPAAAVGQRRISRGDLEAWVPWDRLPKEEVALWNSVGVTWSLLVTENDLTRTLDLGTTSLGEWP